MRFVGKTILEFPSLDSTNEHCREMVNTCHVEEGTVIWTRRQLKGRGQGRNRWESEDGMNLTFSIILHPLFLKAPDQFLLSMVISLGIAGFLRNHLDNVFIKWPNDIYTGNKKIAGILIESSVMDNTIRYSITGIGINVNQTRFSGHLPNPASIKQVTARTLPLEDCLDQVCLEIEHWYRRLKHGDDQEIRNLYTRHLLWLNEKHTFRKAGTLFRAIVRGVDNFGRLALEDEEGFVSHFGQKEVEFID
jgi:BirA family transcriptional regulator, biotin operon repressor / biotin---[acetyl-CoA-carboxylase] ligase